MQIIYSPRAQQELKYWVETHNKEIVYKILKITLAIIDNPFHGIANPEPLKHDLSGCWSRRITQEHRYIYEIKEKALYVHSLKGHYE